MRMTLYLLGFRQESSPLQKFQAGRDFIQGSVAGLSDGREFFTGCVELLCYTKAQDRMS